MLWSPPLLNLRVLVASSVVSKITGRLKIKLPPFLLFWIGWVTLPSPVTVREELFVAITVTEAAEVVPFVLIFV